MFRCRTTAIPATLAMLLLLSPAAAAPEGEAQETPAPQAQQDDHSYLPPWMQPQAKVAEAGTAGAEAQYQNAAAGPAKQNAALPGQKPPQKHHGYSLFGVSLNSLNGLNPFGR